MCACNSIRAGLPHGSWPNRPDGRFAQAPCPICSRRSGDQASISAGTRCGGSSGSSRPRATSRGAGCARPTDNGDGRSNSRTRRPRRRPIPAPSTDQPSMVQPPAEQPSTARASIYYRLRIIRNVINVNPPLLRHGKTMRRSAPTRGANCATRIAFAPCPSTAYRNCLLPAQGICGTRCSMRSMPCTKPGRFAIRLVH